MAKPVAELWNLADRARAGEATPDDTLHLAALATAIIAKTATAWQRRAFLAERLIRLAAQVAPGLTGRAAQRAVSAYLAKYRCGDWKSDSESGAYVGNDAVRSCCFEIMILSDGKLSNRTLQRILTPAPTRGAIWRSEAA